MDVIARDAGDMLDGPCHGYPIVEFDQDPNGSAARCGGVLLGSFDERGAWRAPGGWVRQARAHWGPDFGGRGRAL